MTPARRLSPSLSALLVGLVASLVAVLPAHADFELRDADGRRILLKDDGSWRYVEAAETAAAAPAGEAAIVPPVQAELRLLQRTQLSAACSFTVLLHNKLPYEIRSLVPEFAVQRASGVVYTTQGLGFGPVKPGDSQQRELRILGIDCNEISRLQVQGSDRCDMGELNKFSDVKGACLDRLQVLPSKPIAFEK